MKQVLCLLSSVIIAVILVVSNANCEEKCENWMPKKNPLSYWTLDKANGSIGLNSCGNTNCIRIHRSEKGRTFITRKIKAPFDGNYGFKAIIKATDIVTGDKRYERGKFQVRLFDSWGKNLSAAKNYYPSSDFNNIPNFEALVFTVEDVKKGMAMEVRIGLQEAKGTVYLSEFEHCYLGK